MKSSTSNNEKMVNEQGNFTAKYFSYYCSNNQHSKHELFINSVTRDSISVRLSQNKDELIVLNGMGFNDIDAPTRMIEKSNANRSGFKKAEFSTLFVREVARFSFTEDGINKACEYIRSEAKKRWMVESNGWRFKMKF
ncbi:hypothetical protein PLGE761_02400 [Pluralibacter gergoviae]|uniref:hypothetical protein n=1 Tax=Pluralibacter gergoviae TaxID=61647 RepID=UPI0007DAC450|nr:hypothetical protein [Pluralibacter gergoviae]SUB71810.1 Uncharacterised protein [Pluralibacter gergoviae]HDS1113633.1 hypothetical protein [Pluralibacter gergoviae]